MKLFLQNPTPTDYRQFMKLCSAMLHTPCSDEMFASVQSMCTAHGYPSYSHVVKEIKKLDPNERTLIRNMFSYGQFESKLWLCDALQAVVPREKQYNVFVLGGWGGLLAILLCDLFPNLARHVWTIDNNPAVHQVASRMVRYHLMDNGKIFPILFDMYEMNYQKDSVGFDRYLNETFPSGGPDIIINSSCEHLSSFSKWYDIIPQGKVLALQSNNFFNEKSHVNCVSSLREFKGHCPMDFYLYEGQMDFSKYSRFMLIGVK